MRRIVWIIVIIVVVAGGAFAVFRDPGRIHLFAADGSVLAETELEGWCSGATYWKTRAGGNSNLAAKCRVDKAETLSTMINHGGVQFAFCLGVRAEGFQGDLIEGCLDLLQAQKLWPTIDGQLTQAWSDSYPYPLDQFGATEGDETEDRGHDRGGFTRGGE